MLCSTLFKFQGAILGSLIPNIGQEQVWQNLALSQANSLIASGAINAELKVTNKLAISQQALANLPLILFFHDQPQFLTQQLTALVGEQNLDSSLLLWVRAMALALRDRLSPPYILSQLQQSFPDPLVQAQLEQLQFFSKSNYSINLVAKQLYNQEKNIEKIAMFIAIYCFSATPYDYLTAVNRVKTIPQAAALTGALVGAYQGYGGIPLHQRLKINQETKLMQIKTITTKLYSAWCGVIQPHSSNISLNIKGYQQVVASPQVLQPRPQLKIISQKHLD